MFESVGCFADYLSTTTCIVCIYVLMSTTTCLCIYVKGSPYSISELIPVLGSRPAGDVSHKPGGRLPLLSARPAVTFATLKRAATSFAAW